MQNLLLSQYPYFFAIILMMIGLFAIIRSANLVKKLIGLGIFQTSVLLMYVASGYVRGSGSPILRDSVESYVNPIPHVLMLTAIVVGIATLAVGLAIAVRIKEVYGTIEEDNIR